MCESSNNWIVDIRAHPIISLLEGIRTKVHVRIQQNISKSSKWPGRICWLEAIGPKHAGMRRRCEGRGERTRVVNTGNNYSSGVPSMSNWRVYL
jgi:hypothetical protein